MDDIDQYHAHLDVCRRCREQPFNLCERGLKLLRTAVETTRQELDVEPTEPEPEDLVTSDHVHVYHHEGKLAFTTTPETFEKDCREYMEKTQYWPNVWFISDHGNAHLVRFTA